MLKKMQKTTNVRAATAEDKALGSKIRAFRNAAGISQAELGTLLDPPVSFQQVQKYEKGVNRVSHVKLLQICKALDVQPSDMIGDIRPEGQSSSASAQMIAMMGDNTTFRLVKAFALLPREMQHKIVGLVEAVSHAKAA